MSGREMPLGGIARIVCAVFVASGILQAESDTLPPRLAGLSRDLATVDATGSNQVVTFELRVRDDLSGVDSTSESRLGITLTNVSGNQVAFGLASVQSGVILDGVFQVPVTIPRFAEAGIWQITSLRLRDNAGNTVSLNSADLTAAGFPATVLVEDANPDTAPPQLLGISMSPSAVDVSSGPQTITVDLIVADDRSGISQAVTGLDDFSIMSASARQSRLISITQFQLISGSNRVGVYRATLNMPRYSEPGFWRVNAIRLRDNVGSQRLYGPAALAVFGSSVYLSVSSNPSDTTPPELTRLTFTPAVINTSSSNQTVQVEFAINDDLSGVSFAPDTPTVSQSFGGVFRSPSGAQSVSTNSTFSNAPPISGVPTNGTWRFTAEFPRFSEEGTWTISVSLKDAVRNLASYSPSQLAALGLSRDLIVIRPTQQPDGTISAPAAGGSVSDNTFGDRAKVIAPGGVLSQPTTVTIDVLQAPLQVLLPEGFSGAETYFVNIVLLPAPNFPLHQPGLTIVLPLRNYTIPGTAINLFRIDPAAGNLVAVLNTSGSPVAGHVDAGGLTATFQGVSRLSTLVGLLPATEVTGEVTVAVKVERGAINTKSHANVPVVIFSSPTLDATKIDPSTLRLAGASVRKKPHNRFQISISDQNGDGLPDLLAQFRANELHLKRGDRQAVLEGRTFDNRVIHGVASIRIVK